MIWRCWGRRLFTVPAAAAVALWAVVGLWAALGFLALLIVVGVAVGASGHLDRLMAHEDVHALRCRIRGSWRSVTRGNHLASEDRFPRRSRRMPIRNSAVKFSVRPVSGDHVGTWENAVRGLASDWRAADVEVVDRYSRRGGGTGWIELHVSTLGVPQHTIPWPYPAAMAPPWCWDLGAVPVGQAGGNRREAVSLLDPPHMLVAGPTGGGKSSFLNAILCGVAPLDDVAVVLVDLKGVDFGRWRPRLSALVHDPGEVAETFAWLAAVMEDRFLILRRDGQPQWESSPAGPRIVCIVDEFAELAPALHPQLDRLVRKGRAAGISVIVCTQRPVATLGAGFTNIRSQLGTRVALGPLSRAEANLVLGDGLVPPVWPRFPPGVARIQAAHRGRTVHVYWCREVIDEIVAATAPHRPRVPEGLRLTS